MSVTARDAEATRERILDAALVEFAAYGLAGARVDRIARAAAANKNSIYRYFESKDHLFDAVLRRHLQRVYTDVPFTPDDLPGFTVRLFDYALAHPQIVRLTAWHGLERGADTPSLSSGTMPDKLADLARKKQPGSGGDAFSPGFLFTVISAIGMAWTAVNPIWRSIDPDALDDLASLRDSIARLVERLDINDKAGANHPPGELRQ